MIKFNKGNIEILDVRPVEQFDEVQYYTALISIEDLSKLKERIVYDGDAQRGVVDGNPVIDKKHVNQIYDAFVNGDSIRGHLTWNLRKQDGESEFKFDSENNKLIIKPNQLITIPDSAHRHQALYMIADEIDDDSILNSKFAIDIYAISKSEEIDLFYTINGKAIPPNKNRTLYLSNDIKCKLIREVIAHSELDGKIELVRSNAQKDGRLTKFSTLYDSLFGDTTGSFNKVKINEDNYEEYLKWFVDFYNELLKTRDEFSLVKLSDRKESKKESMLLEELSWWAYGFLAKELMYDRKWRHNLHEKMNKKVKSNDGETKCFFDKSLDIWINTVIDPKFNFTTNKKEASSKVKNANPTRGIIKKIMHSHLL